MWLEAGPSNNNPRIIAGYYIDCVKLLKGQLNCYFETKNSCNQFSRLPKNVKS